MNNSPIQQVCVMNADGTGARNLSDPTIDESSAAWSPDGTKIALTSMFDGYNSRLVMMNADGTGRAPVNAGKVGFSGVPFRQMHSWDYSGPYHGYDGFAIFARDMDMAISSPIWQLAKTAPWKC